MYKSSQQSPFYTLLFAILFFTFLPLGPLAAQGFCHDYGEEVDELARDMIGVSDGDVVTVGFKENANDGTSDLHVVKTDALGAVVWARTLDLREVETRKRIPTVGRAIIQDAAGDLVIVGHSLNDNGGIADGLLVKMDLAGNFTQSRLLDNGSLISLGGVTEIVAASGGPSDYAVAGRTTLNGNGDFYIARVDNMFNLVWARNSGGSQNEAAREIIALPNGSLAILGQTQSFGAGGRDLWILGLTGNGNTVLGSSIVGGPNDEFGNDIIAIPTGFLVVGSTNSPSGGTRRDILTMRFNGAFGFLNDQIVALPNESSAAETVIPNPAGGFIVAGDIGDGTMDLFGLRLNGSGIASNMIRFAHTNGGTLDGGFPVIYGNGQIAVGGTSTELNDDLFQAKFSNASNCCGNGQSFNTSLFPWIFSTGPQVAQDPSIPRIPEREFKDGTPLQVLCPTSKRFATELEAASDAVSVYPNPAHDRLFIEVDGEIEGEIFLQDAFGRMVKRMNAQPGQQSLDLNGLAPGIYLLQVPAGNTMSTHKIVVE